MFGEIAPNLYTCSYHGKFYICVPRGSVALDAFTDLQRAIDTFLLRLPLFRKIEPELRMNPIGSSASGYDGRIGPITSGLGLVALIGAMDVRKAAGLDDVPQAIFNTVSDITEQNRTSAFARYATEIVAYLNDTSARFNELLAEIERRRAEGERPVVVEPPIPVPPEIKSAVRRVNPVGYVVMGALGLVGVGIAYAYNRKERGATSNFPFFGTRGGLTVDRVHINRQGYDSDGRYWGVGQRLYRVEASDGERVFVRADNAKEARTRGRQKLGPESSYDSNWRR